MKKLLTLFVLALSFSAVAEAQEEATTPGASKERVRKERMHNVKPENYKEYRRSERPEARNGENMRNGQRSEAVKQAKMACAEKCNLNKEKIKQCRKAKGMEKGQKDGSCVSDKKQSCMKSCISNKRDRIKENRGEARGDKMSRAEGKRRVYVSDKAERRVKSERAERRDRRQSASQDTATAE